MRLGTMGMPFKNKVQLLTPCSFLSPVENYPLLHFAFCTNQTGSLGEKVSSALPLHSLSWEAARKQQLYRLKVSYPTWRKGNFNWHNRQSRFKVWSPEKVFDLPKWQLNDKMDLQNLLHTNYKTKVTWGFALNWSTYQTAPNQRLWLSKQFNLRWGSDKRLISAMLDQHELGQDDRIIPWLYSFFFVFWLFFCSVFGYLCFHYISRGKFIHWYRAMSNQEKCF